MKTHSYHIFMFPFSLKAEWTLNDIAPMLQKAGWERKQFFYDQGDYAANFSEQGYFYDFSTGAMFDDSSSQHRTLTTYQYPLRGNDTFTIHIKKRDLEKTYTLQLEKIELHLYDEKAAILSFHLNNDQYPDIQDILFINDFGRRIYPQFLAKDKDGNIDLKITKNVFLADSICLNLDGRPPLTENFSSYAQFSESRPPYHLPEYIEKLLPVDMRDCRWLLDDRMYVVSYFFDRVFSAKMKQAVSFEGKLLEENTAPWWWYQYVFVDNDGPTCQNEEMMQQLLKKSTYVRWSGYGTFFGVSRYSFVALVGNDAIGLQRNIQTMYYRMASLVLAQRVLLLYYSREISEISQVLNKTKLADKALRARVATLNLNYLRFVNNIYFREVTPQDQGIELYDMLQEQMNIKRDEEGLSSEVEQVYHFVTMSNDENRNEEVRRLSIIATLFLPLSLIAAIWSMNADKGCILTLCIVLSCIAFLAFIFFVIKFIIKKNN